MRSSSQLTLTPYPNLTLTPTLTFTLPLPLTPYPRTDNGAPFQSYKFSEFAHRLGFKHRRITPYWPRANGEAERLMRNLNKVIRNAATNGRSKQQELQLFLRAYRATPHSVTKIAPND